jgi:pantetheine-phosphate adenylyltransferase
MTEKIAIYPGSFDPITNGHVDIIERATKLFIARKVHVVVANNRDKKHMFEIDERMAIAEASLSHLKDKIELVSFEGIISDYAKEKNADVLVRGIRDYTDFSYEIQLEQFTRQTSSLETVYLSPYTSHLNTSSSLVRMFIQSGNIAEAKNYMCKEGFYAMEEILKGKN